MYDQTWVVKVYARHDLRPKIRWLSGKINCYTLRQGTSCLGFALLCDELTQFQIVLCNHDMQLVCMGRAIEEVVCMTSAPVCMRVR